MRLLWAAALLLRRVRTEAAILLLLFGVVASTSFLFAAAPRLFNRVTDDALHYALAGASSVDRDIRMNGTGSIEPGVNGGVSAARAYGEERERDLPDSISRLISGRFLGVTSVRFAVRESIVAVSLRYQDGVPDATRLVSGRWPVDRGMPLRRVELGQAPSVGGEAPVIIEAALSTVAAEVSGVQLGQRLRVALDGSDPIVRSLPFGIAPTEIEVVGLYEPLDPAADEWDRSVLLDPTLVQGPSGVEAIQATAFVPAEVYPSLHAGLLPFRFDWRFNVDPARVDADQVAPLQADLRRLGLIASTQDERYLDAQSSAVRLSDVSFGSGLPGVVDGFAGQRARSLSVLLIAALGPLCLAAAAIAMLAILLVRRRTNSLLLARGRGASGRLLLVTQLIEAVIVAGSASLLGLALALIAVPARDAPLSAVLAMAVAGASALLLVAATWPTARRPLMQLERDDAPLLHVPPRRLVIEATIVAIAIVAVVLLRQRGLSAGSVAGSESSDPLLAAVPLLSGIAAGIVAMRLYLVPVRGLGWLAARRRDFVPVVGLRTVARRPAGANLSLLVLMLAAAFASFASVIESSIARGQVAASYLQVGADYRLEAIGVSGLPSALDPSSIPGVEAFAWGSVDRRAVYVSAANQQRAGMDLNAVDARAFATVTDDTAAGVEWPREFLVTPPSADIGTQANAIPAILSPDFPPGRDELGIGDTFVIEVARQALSFQVVDRRAGFPGLGGAANSVTAPLDWISASLGDDAPLPTVMWLRASDDAGAPLATLVTASAGQIGLVSRQDAYSQIHDAPLGTAVADGFRVALGVAVLYLAITLVGAVVMSAAGRTRDLAYLRTLGVSTRQALALTAVEHAPPVLLALVPGVLLGVAVAHLVEPGLGLADFTGGRFVALSIDWPALGLVIAALSVVVVVSIGAGTWLAARARLVSALRIEDS